MIFNLQLTLISAAVAASVGFGSAWQIQSLRADSKELEHAESQITLQADARKLDQARASALAAAQAAGAARQIDLRRDADRSRADLAGLRVASERALSAARADPAACAVTADAQAIVLSECGAELQTLAGIADRHASDAQTLMDAWPR
jgi:hypothetical protein